MSEKMWLYQEMMDYSFRLGEWSWSQIERQKELVKFRYFDGSEMHEHLREFSDKDQANEFCIMFAAEMARIYSNAGIAKVSDFREF